MLKKVKLTAVFETWHIHDGNYPPLRSGQQVNLSFEIEPDMVDKADSSQDFFIHLGEGQYEFQGSILRTYVNDPQSVITIVKSGDFNFYINRALGVTPADRIRGRGMLLLDHYSWVEFLDQYADPPDLFFQLLVERIRRVQPTSLAPVSYGPERIVDVEMMEGQDFDEEFYLLDLTDEGVLGQVSRTFISLGK
jgi:hypothetical protein